MMDKSRLALCALLFTVTITIILTNVLFLRHFYQHSPSRWFWPTLSPRWSTTTRTVSTTRKALTLAGAFLALRPPPPSLRWIFKKRNILIKIQPQIIKSSTSSLLLSAFNAFILITGGSNLTLERILSKISKEIKILSFTGLIKIFLHGEPQMSKRDSWNRFLRSLFRTKMMPMFDCILHLPIVC